MGWAGLNGAVLSGLEFVPPPPLLPPQELHSPLGSRPPLLNQTALRLPQHCSWEKQSSSRATWTSAMLHLTSDL